MLCVSLKNIYKTIKMSLYYNILITGGTSPGPYTVYYNAITNGTIATIFTNGLPASGLSYSTLTAGLQIVVPDGTTSIILFNDDKCNLYKTFLLPPQPKDYPNLCFGLVDIESYVNISLSYKGNELNGKPIYSNFDDSIYIQWNNVQNYWEMIGYPTPPEKFISSNPNDIPDTNWVSIGSQYIKTISVVQGDCNLTGKPNLRSLDISLSQPTCQGVNNGTINVVGVGSTGWTYSLDGVLYNNFVGIFNNLSAGLYTVYGKDGDGNIISEPVTLTAQPITYFNIPNSTVVTNLTQVGNTKYYLLDIVYNTSLIPSGETITFDYKFTYNMIYNQPGFVVFDTTNNTIIKNGTPYVASQVSSTPLSVSNPLPCNPTYYNQLVESETYQLNSVSLTNTDTFEVQIVYGIDTDSGGSFINGCITQGSVNINANFENVQTTCNCCTLNGSQINNIGIPQIYTI